MNTFKELERIAAKDFVESLGVEIMKTNPKEYPDQLKKAGVWVLKNRGALTAASASLAGSAWAYASYIEPHWLEVSRPALKTEELEGVSPAWKGFKVAFLSDWHLPRKGPAPRVMYTAIEKVLEERPNLVTLGGDYFNYGTWNPCMSELVRPLIQAGLPVVAVMGNHDYFGRRNEYQRILKAFEREGVEVLMNAARPVEYNGQRGWIMGIDDYIKGEPNIEDTRRGVPEGERPLLLLSHNPIMLKKIPANFAHVTLSGHTHGGQVNFALPPLHRHLNWLKFARNQHHSPYPLGWYEYNGNRLYVGRGLGTSGFKLRFNARPELVMLHFE